MADFTGTILHPMGLRINYFQGRIEAWDADSSDPWQQNRNLHFRNDVGELSALFEINYLDHQIGNPGTASPHLHGLGIYTHMPEAELDGLDPAQPLERRPCTTGDANGVDAYGTTGISIPFGPFNRTSDRSPRSTSTGACAKRGRITR